jgi:hypothetical protein
MKLLKHLFVVRAVVSPWAELSLRAMRWAAWPALLICIVGGHAVRGDVVYFTQQNVGVYQVAQGGTPTVFVAQTGDVAPGANHLNQTLGLGIDGAGNLYASSLRNAVIVKIAPDASTSVLFDGHTDSLTFVGIAVDKSGNVYAAARNYGEVYKITSAGVVTALASGLHFPDTVAVGPDGTVYSSNEDNTITKITPSGAVSTFAPALSGGLAVDSSGNLYVSSGHTIQKLLPDGTDMTFVSGLSAPGNLAFGSDGNLYAGDNSTNTVLVIDPSGVASTFSQYVPNGGDLAVRTPEPSGVGGTLFFVALASFRRGRRARR